jgi:hypothetical protein
MHDMAIDCMELTSHRLYGTPVRKQDLATRSDVKFVEMELAAALTMAEDALSLVPDVKAIVGPTLKEAMNADEVYEAIYHADRMWRNNSFKAGVASEFSEAMALSVATGVNTASDAVMVDGYFRNRVIDGMTRSAKYYSNEFFNKHVMPALENAVNLAVTGNQPAGTAGFKFVQQTLNARLKSVPYWRLVANAAASRSYHYGLLKGGSAIGRTGYRYEAVIDERTSEVCRVLHGREWRIDDAVGLIEKIASAEDPEEVKSISPWLKPSDVEGLTNKELRDLGVILPPAHGNCRSTLVLI